MRPEKTTSQIFEEIAIETFEQLPDEEKKEMVQELEQMIREMKLKNRMLKMSPMNLYVALMSAMYYNEYLECPGDTFRRIKYRKNKALRKKVMGIKSTP